MSTPTPKTLVLTLSALVLFLLQSSLSDAKCGPMFHERDVVVLAKSNFTDFLSKNRYVLVNYYAPWCYWSRKLAPEFAAAATKLKGEAVLAKVNGPLEREITVKNKINCYPSLVFYVDGVKVHNYYRNRSREALVSYVRSVVEMSKSTVRTRKEAKRLIDAKTTAVLGYLPCLKGKEAEIFAAAAKLHSNVKFYQFVSPYVAETFHIYPLIKRPAVVVMKEGRQFTLYVGAFGVAEIGKFVGTEAAPALLAAEAVLDNGQKELEEDDTITEALFSFPNVFTMIMGRLTEAAKRFKRNVKLDYI